MSTLIPDACALVQAHSASPPPPTSHLAISSKVGGSWRVRANHALHSGGTICEMVAPRLGALLDGPGRQPKGVLLPAQSDSRL
jgi:hypothetical protein